MAKSKWLSALQKSNKSAVELYDYRNQLVGAVGSEINDLIKGSLMTANAYLKFARDMLLDADDELLDDPQIKKQLGLIAVSAGSLKLLESNAVEVDFVDPYENEYVPAELCGLTESVNEDAEPLSDELDDDPDAVISTDVDGMPVKFDNTPLELDPFAVRMFRNNGELIDPPEVFDVVKDAPETTEPEIDPGVATPAEVDDAAADDFIDVIADITGQPQEVPEVDPDTTEIVTAVPAEKDETITELPVPPDDFDVFANESTRKVARVTPKNDDGLPAQFESVKHDPNAVDNIASAPGNNLKMLSFLLSGDGIW